MGAARRPARRRRGRRGVGAPAARREGRRPRDRPRRAARGVQRPGPGAGRRGASPPRSSGWCPPTPTGRARRHRLAPRRRAAADRRSTTPRSSAAARERLRAKLSYTNLGFALAPREFTISALRELYAAALGHPVSATNLQRVLTRRARAGADGRRRAARPGGRATRGAVPVRRPALRVTDAFAVLRPPEASDARRRPYRERVAETLPLFPLGTVLMPGASLPLHIFEPRYRQLTVDLVTGAVPDKEFGVVAVREGWTPATTTASRPAQRRLHGRAARRAPAARRPLRHRHPRRRAASGCWTSTPSRSRTSWASVEYLPDVARAQPTPHDLTRMLAASARAAHRATAPRRGRTATGPSPPPTSSRATCPTCSPPTACSRWPTASACWSRPRPTERLRMVRLLLARETGLLTPAARRPRPDHHVRGGAQPQLTASSLPRDSALRYGDSRRCARSAPAEARPQLVGHPVEPRAPAPRPRAGSRARRPPAPGRAARTTPGPRGPTRPSRSTTQSRSPARSCWLDSISPSRSRPSRPTTSSGRSLPRPSSSSNGTQRPDDLARVGGAVEVGRVGDLARPVPGRRGAGPAGRRTRPGGALFRRGRPLRGRPALALLRLSASAA